MACIIWLMSIIIYAEYGLYFLANVWYYLANVDNKYAEYGLYYLANVNNISGIYSENGLCYLANVNKYMQNMACII